MGTRLWKIATNHMSLWVTWVKARYCKNRSVWSIEATQSSSSLWRKILHSISWLRDNTNFIITDGKSINLWDDPWINGFGLKHYFNNLSLLHWGPPRNASVASLIVDGKWRKPIRWPSEFNNVWDVIEQLGIGGYGPDILVWTGSKNGQVSCSSAWNRQKVVLKFTKNCSKSHAKALQAVVKAPGKMTWSRVDPRMTYVVFE
ncbi:hypothetical protein QJS10_CPB17g00356 [Acorus calamus]|uniref:Cyclic nucleotide-binding domain-containing protein n=1 Tax=Acorus calamus TaxID=4465 RepID=A0AAV9CQM5_ACOCL|nr:hypothetical protein QJS10_CPB17g00356 [Acorus calamus]